MAKSRIAFDTNIWISFTIGKRLSHLRNILQSNNYDVYYCAELVKEYIDVARRKKLARHFSEERILDTIDLMESFAIKVKIYSAIIHPTDVKDSYLLSLCADAGLDFLITGDKDLLRMRKSGETVFITFSQFVSLQSKRT